MARWSLGGEPFRPVGQVETKDRLLYPFIERADGQILYVGAFVRLELPQSFDVLFNEDQEDEFGVLCAPGATHFKYYAFLQEVALEDGEELCVLRWLASSRELAPGLDHEWCVRLNANGDEVSDNISLQWIETGVSVTAFGTPLSDPGVAIPEPLDIINITKGLQYTDNVPKELVPLPTTSEANFRRHLPKGNAITPAFLLLVEATERPAAALPLPLNGANGTVVACGCHFTSTGSLLELKLGNCIQKIDGGDVYYILEYDANLCCVHAKVCVTATEIAEVLPLQKPWATGIQAPGGGITLEKYKQQLFLTDRHKKISHFSGYRQVNVVHHELINICLQADFVLTQAVLFNKKKRSSKGDPKPIGFAPVEFHDLQGQVVNTLTVLPAVAISGASTLQVLLEQLKQKAFMERNKNRYQTDPLLLLGGTSFLQSLKTTSIVKGTANGRAKVHYTLDTNALDLQYVGIDSSVLFSLPVPLRLVVDFRVHTAVLRCGALDGDDYVGAAAPLQL